ncbi:hypothetical protein KSC_107120 [Ktedonobacter sp. SOSP1-52]|uniref:hypothetical protein n=1 Tax=Ktedonobacter sp. SOSP1-52 TaxID=2778366 RepID=UPI001915A5C5|nr:hypothetical protein [Ktedonobacter sp. SOSP1-52]GHO71820.1 hypothetical protein KSC_107120 [Ktedonobacter sp. SOSP1-52]
MLLEQLAEQSWQISFPYHHWITYLDYLVGGVASGREPRWYNPALARTKVFPLQGETDIEDNRNVVKGEMLYCYNASVGRGKIYPPFQEGMHPRPVARTRAQMQDGL